MYDKKKSRKIETSQKIKRTEKLREVSKNKSSSECKKFHEMFESIVKTSIIK